MERRWVPSPGALLWLWATTMAASSRQEDTEPLSALSKLGWHQTAVWEAPGFASDRRNSNFFHDLALPVEIFRMEENDILCFLNWKIVLGDSLLRA